MNHSDWVRDVAWAPSTGLDRLVKVIEADYDGKIKRNHRLVRSQWRGAHLDEKRGDIHLGKSRPQQVCFSAVARVVEV